MIFIKYIGENCFNSKRLNLHARQCEPDNENKLTNKGLFYLKNSHKNMLILLILTELALDYVKNIIGDGLRCLADNCLNLEFIDISSG